MLLLHNGTVAREYGGDTVEGHEAGDDCADEIRGEGTGRGGLGGWKPQRRDGALRMEAAGKGGDEGTLLRVAAEDSSDYV